MQILTTDTVAREIYRTNSWRKFDSAGLLVDAIDRYLASLGLAKSTISRLDVADHVLKLQREAQEPEPVRQPLATPEQVAWQQQQMQGVGDRQELDEVAIQQMDEMALAGRVQAMSAAEFGRQRERLGLQKSVLDFLAGR